MGWCEACDGLGIQQGASPAAIVVHPTRSIAAGAIAGWDVLEPYSKLHLVAEALADHIGFSLDTPWNDLTETQRLAFLHGTGDDWIAVNGNPRGPGKASLPAPPNPGRQMATTDRVNWLVANYGLEEGAAHQLIGRVGIYDVVTVAGSMALRIPKANLP